MTSRSTPWIAILVTSLLAAGASEAGADEIVGILDVRTSGISAGASKRFEASIEEGLADSRFKVAPRKRLMALLANSSYVAGCTFGPCLKEVYRNTKVRLILNARISAAGPSYSFVLSLFDTRTGLLTSQISDRCEVCTLQDAITTTNLKVVALVEGVGGAKVVDPARGPTHATPLEAMRAKVRSLELRLSKKKRATKTRVRRVALFLVGIAAITGGGGAYFFHEDRKNAGYSAVAAAGGLTFASLTLLVLSRGF